MIYVTGDCHGDWTRFQPNCFPEQKEMTRDDYLIVCGDFGIWHDNNGKEKEKLDAIARLPYTILFVDGNHENFNRLNTEFEEVDFCGGKAHKIRENLYHLERGYVFTLQDKKFFCFGGASSHDIGDGILIPSDFTNEREFKKVYNKMWEQGKMFRVKDVSWWEEELPSDEEYIRGIFSLKDYNQNVDYIISHCCPQSIADVIGRGFYNGDSLTEYFDEIAKATTFSKWLFGHYHIDRNIYGKYVALYYQIIRIV